MTTCYELLLLEGLLNYFSVVEVEAHEKIIILHLDDKILSTEENLGNKYISKGFYTPTDIHDFPLLCKSLILWVRRRRWQDKLSGNPYMQNWSVVAGGYSFNCRIYCFFLSIILTQSP